MCNFKSAICVKDEKVKGGFSLLLSPWTESHSELEIIFKLRENVRLNYAKVEFSPADMATADKIDTYKFTVDEDRCPNWFGKEMQEDAKTRLADYIKRILVTGDVQLLCGGQFIVAAGAKIECAHNVILNAVLSGGTVQSVLSGGTVQRVESGGTVQSVLSGGTVQSVWSGGTVQSVLSGAIIIEDFNKK